MKPKLHIKAGAFHHCFLLSLLILPLLFSSCRSIAYNYASDYPDEVLSWVAKKDSTTTTTTTITTHTTDSILILDTVEITVGCDSNYKPFVIWQNNVVDTVYIEKLLKIKVHSDSLYSINKTLHDSMTIIKSNYLTLDDKYHEHKLKEALLNEQIKQLNKYKYAIFILISLIIAYAIGKFKRIL